MEESASTPTQPVSAATEQSVPEEDVLSVFLSHRHDDSKAATQIRNNLEIYAPQRLKFYLSEEIPGGTDWHEWMHSKIRESQWFLLLFTDPSHEWDWCLFEAGMFRAMMDDATRLICLHHANSTIPEQLSRFQGYSATPNRVREFLTELFARPAVPGLRPLNEGLLNNREAIRTLTQSICEIIETPKVMSDEIPKFFFNKYVDLHIRCAGDQINEEILGQAFMKTGSFLEDIFSIVRLPRTWGDFTALIKQMNKARELGDQNLRWLDQTTEAIRNAGLGLSFNQPEDSLRGLKDKKSYRSIVHHMRRIDDEDDPNCFVRILFIAEAGDGRQ